MTPCSLEPQRTDSFVSIGDCNAFYASSVIEESSNHSPSRQRWRVCDSSGFVPSVGVGFGESGIADPGQARNWGLHPDSSYGMGGGP